MKKHVFSLVNRFGLLARQCQEWSAGSDETVHATLLHPTSSDFYPFLWIKGRSLQHIAVTTAQAYSGFNPMWQAF